MSRTRIVKGKITEIVENDYNIFSESNIVDNAAEMVTDKGERNGVIYGKTKTFEGLGTKSCDYIPPSVGKGSCNYYVDRFKNFMKRHTDCLHTPPVYYYGPLRDIKEKGKLSEYEKAVIRLKVLAQMKLSIFGNVDGHVEIDAAEKKRLQEDNALPQYTKGNKNVIPTPNGSYGYKYCTSFTNELMPRLTKAGQAWLNQAKMDLQTYMEQGVVDKYYISKYNTTYNIKNNLTKSNGVTPFEPKTKINLFYNNIELNNTKFQSFAFATHPDAYNPKKMSILPVQDLFRILLTPDMKEWMGKETWEQAWTMAKNMDYGSVTKASWEELKKDTKESLESAGNKLKSYWDEIFK
ncbi:hypothetical protein [Chryseobacterium sp. BIGb0232]|uniref:hypothetical protein n=1 Tax=Chryseobacterium sp. BIGb0232 TaxID=2940598 RepID=UPI000F49FA97|nr:hypothetical protein [Chryseobacterium sp. BIGb0232]MCS4305089.1 hypothetical protein [Chryseobacterium sp. BIGb0232]ROS08095.1 hypothetical protein EDF65_4544 [Chryseobacterium nakagawai]